MKLSELKTGMIVKLRNGARYLVVKDTGHTNEFIPTSILLNLNDFCYNSLSRFNNDLTNKFSESDDIISVYTTKYIGDVFRDIQRANMNLNRYKLIYNRKLPKKLTHKEIEALLGYEVEITK